MGDPISQVSRVHLMVEFIDYLSNAADEGVMHFQGAHFQSVECVPNKVSIRTILRKSTDKISMMSLDSGKGSTEKTSPFDTFAQIIEGKGEVFINGQSYPLENGQGIIIPAHQPHFIKPNGSFKVIVAAIQGGYPSL